ncbi:hypothetical protein [Croceibacterium ferulae]|uniref:hypothetical protein n=1 Tax=Croceibacterium ferulae TaxID=1854641 RepID=UPI000F87E8B1|nr:hypothetical protein [Croceibacterium ferulae]
MGMQVESFEALRSVKIGNDEATKVVAELEGHTAMKISEANAPLIAELKSMQKGLNRTKWYFWTAIVIAGVVVAVTNALNRAAASAPL